MVQLLLFRLEIEFAVFVIAFEHELLPFSFVVRPDMVLQVSLVIEGSVTIKISALIRSFSNVRTVVYLFFKLKLPLSCMAQSISCYNLDNCRSNTSWKPLSSA